MELVNAHDPEHHNFDKSRFFDNMMRHVVVSAGELADFCKLFGWNVLFVEVQKGCCQVWIFQKFSAVCPVCVLLAEYSGNAYHDDRATFRWTLKSLHRFLVFKWNGLELLINGPRVNFLQGLRRKSTILIDSDNPVGKSSDRRAAVCCFVWIKICWSCVLAYLSYFFRLKIFLVKILDQIVKIFLESRNRIFR